MAHIEPMDVDSISNDFDNKENSLQHSNVLPRTPSTEKGYEELDVSELNMKLRYSMTPASSPMSRSFTANCRDNKMCDNENNSITSVFSDNVNLTHSFNSTITDSILKSSKFPLQVLPTEQFVDDNGNPIIRSLDVECNNVTITVNGNDNLDDNLSLPSTSSSLVHTPEATTPTKEIAKDGGSPIMRGLKSVLNMFRSSQSPIPPDDISTSEFSSFEFPKKEESSKYTTNLDPTQSTTDKCKENISKTNSPLKESLVFNEDLEKELLWKDETTILFKDEKIPIHKLFFPPSSAVLEKINSKPIEKENLNTTVEYMDISLNETVITDKTMTEVQNLCPEDFDTLNSHESDSEFVDCETSYTKNDTRILDNNTPALSANIYNISTEFAISDENIFQSNCIVAEENSLSEVAGTDLANETSVIIANIDDVINESDIDDKCNQTILNDLPFMRKSLNHINVLSNSFKEVIPNELADKCNTNFYENANESVQYSNETFNLEKNSETTDLDIDQENKKQNDIVKTSNTVGNDASLCEEAHEDFQIYSPSPITNEIQNNISEELGCNLDATIVLNELNENQTDTLKINDITQPLESELVNEIEMDLGVVQDQIITIDNIEMPLDKGEEIPTVDIKCNVKLDSEIIKDNITKQKDNNETDTFILPPQIIQLGDKEIKIVNSNLPSEIPLPYDSDIDKDNLLDINEENSTENDNSVNISSNSLSLDLHYSTESIKQTIDEMTPPTETHSETILDPAINSIVSKNTIIQTSQLGVSEEMSNINKDVTVNESDVLITKKNNIEKHMTNDIGDTDNEFSNKIIDNVILSSNNNCSVNEIDLNVLTHHTQDIQQLNSLSHDECVQKSKPTVTDDKNVIESIIDVKIHDGVSFSSTNDKTLVTGMELDVSKYDSENGENKLTASLELQRCDSINTNEIPHNRVESITKVTDNTNNITNEIDDRVTYDEDIPISNINTSVIGMGLDVPKHDYENSGNPIESRNIPTTALEIPGRDSDTESVTGSKYTEMVATIFNDKHKITIKTDVKINEEESLPAHYNNSLKTEMELDVSKPDLEDNGNLIETKTQLKLSPEEDSLESVIENMNAKNNYKNISLDDNSEITSENDFKTNKEISIPSTSNNLVTEIELDVLKHDLIASENLIKELCRDRDSEDCEISQANFETIPRLSDEKVKITSKRDLTMDEEINIPFNKEISSENNLGVSKYDEENIENTFETKGSIPSSPPISSKFTQNGYSINFDEIDDPFATKTNIRISPTSDISKDDLLNSNNSKFKTEFPTRLQANRRKTVHDRKKPTVVKKRANASFDCVLKDNNIVGKCEENLRIQEIHIKDSEKQDDIERKYNSASSDELQDDIETIIPRNCTFSGQEENIVEDAEVKLYTEIYRSKNVFNLPEIDDINFNPFATHSKIHQSPTKETENNIFDTSKINNNQRISSDVCNNRPTESTNINSATIDVKNDNVQILESYSSPNLSNKTCSPDLDITSVQEVHTEDEDTVEGPFLEAEDFADIVKDADIETEKDMMNFEDLPTPTNDDENGEFFIDAEAFEFLLNKNKSNVVADSGKESLFLKFDPLFAKRVSSDGVLAALSKIQKRQSTPKKPAPLKFMHEEENPTPGPSTTKPIGITVLGATDIVEEPAAAMSKPMMVVNPAVASIASPRKSTTPPRVNRRSLTFTSPAMAVIDRLLSLSGNNSRLDQDSSLPPSREYNDTDFALTQLRELLAEKEIHVHNLRSESKELKERLAILESQVRSLETESEERLNKVKELNEHLSEKNKINKGMAIVVEEYERTIASLIAEMEQEKKQNAEERMKLISERDEQTAHLASMEVSFSDLHSKYEKSKQIILSMKANEDTYKKSLNEFEVNLLKMQTNYDLLKQHATSKLNHANQELEKYNRAHDAEVLKLNAMIKRKDLHITSLEESLSQKTKANEELTAICDELINKVG